MDRSDLRGWLLTIVQYAIAIAALAWLLSGLQLGEVGALLGRLDATTIALLALITVGGLLGRFYTWHVLMDAVQPTDFRAAASTDLIVNFVNQLLPSRLSGRVAAPFVLRSRTGMGYPDAAAVSGVHTGLYAVLYGLAAAIGLLLAFDRLSLAVVALLALSTALYAVAGGVVLLAGWNLTILDRLLEWVRGLARLIPRVGTSLAERVEGTVEFTAASMDAFQNLTAAPSIWARYGVGWTVALVLAPGLRVWLLLSAFGVAFSPAYLLPLYLVMAYSVTLLPLTPGGIGITEATASVVFVALGVPSTVAVSVILVDRFLGVYLPSLGGWYPSLSIDRASLAADE